jgi:hypothetical protein
MKARPKIEEANPQVDTNTAIENYYNALEQWAEEAEQENNELREVKQAAIYARASLSSPSMDGSNIRRAKEFLEQALKK